MRKIFLLLICILTYNLYNCQADSQNMGITQPVPSISSLATYTNVPVSIQTGIPNISYPLINIPTNNRYVNVSLGLNYHAANVSSDSYAGDTGLGWSLLGEGAISREVLYDFDEVFDDASNSHYIKNTFDDIYNFSIPGESGKFRFIRDVTNNTFQIIKLSPYTAKVDYNRTSNQATLILDSFTITSDKGIKYKFEKYNISTMNVWTWGQVNHGALYTDKTYRSAFYLSSILDQDNQELVNYTYQKDTKYVLGSGNQIVESETNKLTRIDIKDRGIIEINYSNNNQLNKKNDPFSIDNIVLKTNNNVFVRKFKFDYSYTPVRILNSFSQVDVNEAQIEKSQFAYEDIFSALQEGGQISAKALRRAKLPTGGAIEYNFDFLPHTYRDSVKTVLPPEVDFGNVSFDQFNSNTKKYYFTVTQDKELTIEIFANQLANYPWSLNFFKKVGSAYQSTSYAVGPVSGADPSYPVRQTRTFTPGEYYVSLTSDQLPLPTFTGSVNFRAFYYDGVPTEAHVPIPVKGLPRIKNIKYFDMDYANVNNFSAPSKIEEYDYSKFDDPTTSSGYLVEGGSADAYTPANPVVIYKNVKVSNGGNNGYTKYYYKAPDAYPAYPYDTYTDIWPNYNITREGLLDKKEVYNASNQKIMEDNFEYTLQDFDGPVYLVYPSYISTNFHLKTAWIKNQKITSKVIYSTGTNQTVSEIIKNNTNYQTGLEKTTSSDGSIQETTYQYVLDKNNQKLISNNMTGILLETAITNKKDASDVGILVSKKETKYDDPVHKFPTSVNLTDARTNILSTEITYDKYDSKGNVLQYTTKEGMPVTVVWGYNTTQPIAKVEGATYDQVSPYTSDMVAKSDADIDTISEQALLDALDTFRNNTTLSGYLITTYVYDPLVGMKSMTPSSGIREFYQYDNANRLKQIVDENGKVLKKYQYGYK